MEGNSVTEFATAQQTLQCKERATLRQSEKENSLTAPEAAAAVERRLMAEKEKLLAAKEAAEAKERQLMAVKKVAEF